jgi:stage II sporulation protein D
MACAHKPLTSPLVFSGGEHFAGGTIRVADASDPAVADTASGLWHVRSNAEGLDVVVTLPSESYTAAVVSAETTANEPDASLRAMAIVARTYALNGSHYSAGAGHLPADQCDSTVCQAIRLGAASAAVTEAVRATAGETLWFRDARADVFFSQHCGGQTADVTEAWTSVGATRALPYLRSHADPFCLRLGLKGSDGLNGLNGPAAWHASVSLEELQIVAQREGWRLPARVVSVRVAQRSGSGRVSKLTFGGDAGEFSTLSASALRFGVGRAFSWNRIRSDLYEVALRDHALIFDGRGHGHGVGLCQAGATEMALERHDDRAILAFYFPGTQVRITPADEGWRETHVGPLRVRSSTALSPATWQDLLRAWQSTLQQFPVTRPLEPLVVFAPSTELYRQMTGQPGWNLASTKSGVITLQPEQILRKARGEGVGEESTLRHELMHVLIESEATDRAPLWLREGLAERVSPFAGAASDISSGSSEETGAQLDAVLQHADSAGAAYAAHMAAGVRVHCLVARYGLPAVRGWLRSGVPSSAGR